MTTVTFANAYSWGSASNNYSNRPYAWIDVHGPTGSVTSFWALMDSGADYLQIDTSVATSLGISLAGVASHIVHVASGSTVAMHLIKGVTAKIEGTTVTVDALVGPTRIPLVGRTAIVAAMTFGMDSNDWMSG